MLAALRRPELGRKAYSLHPTLAVTQKTALTTAQADRFIRPPSDELMEPTFQ